MREALRASPLIRYHEVRGLKGTVLHRAFDYFRHREWATGTRRAAALRAFIEDQAWWLDDYALFRAIHARQQERRRQAELLAQLVQAVLRSGERMSRPGEEEVDEADLWPREDLFCIGHDHDTQH